MLIFKDEELKQKTRELIMFFREKGIGYDFDEIEDWELDDGEELDPDEYPEHVIDYDTEVYFDLSYDAESYDTTLERCIEIKDDILDSKLDGHIYKSKNKLIMRVASSEIRYESFIEQMETTFMYKGKNYYIDLIEKSEEYAISVFLNDDYNKYIPPTLSDDLYIYIYCEEGLDENINAIIERYIFEVDSIFGIQLFPSPRPEYIDYYDEEDEGMEDNRKIIDTEVNDNLTEILSIFNKASNIESIESKILGYARVIEYASQTVIKKDLFESVLNKLSSDRVFNPDSDYILELEKIFKENNKYGKDREAIKITVKQCCDAMNLKLHAPEFLKKVNKLKTDSEKSKQLEALEELGEAIADTRNMFSHAKTNYNKKGMECPEKELFEFGECMKVVANQVIRWYARQSNTYIIK